MAELMPQGWVRYWKLLGVASFVGAVLVAVVLQDWKIAAFCLCVSVLSVGLVAFWRAKAAEAEPG